MTAEEIRLARKQRELEAVEREKDEELAWMMNRNIDLERMWNASERYAKHCVTTIKEAGKAAAGILEEKRMNQDNYASLEASKRLVEAGIVLETDMAWTYMPKDLYRAEFRAETIWKWRLVDRKEGVCGKWFPAPAWPEVWRELPDGIVVNGSYAELYIMKNEYNGTCCGYSIEDHIIFSTRADNPTDALIDLLIWVRKEAKHAYRR